MSRAIYPTVGAKEAGEVIRRRREDLGVRRAEAARRSNISPETWKVIEDGGRTVKGVWKPAAPDALTLAALDPVLMWEAGSAQRVMEGGEPTPIPHGEQALVAALAELAAEVQALAVEVRTRQEGIQAEMAQLRAMLAHQLGSPAPQP